MNHEEKINKFNVTKTNDSILLKMPKKKKASHRVGKNIHNAYVTPLNTKTVNSIQKWTNDSTIHFTKNDEMVTGT